MSKEWNPANSEGNLYVEYFKTLSLGKRRQVSILQGPKSKVTSFTVTRVEIRLEIMVGIIN